jgi:penicillin-binding protein 2
MEERFRGLLIVGFLGILFLVYIGRLFTIQVLSEEYSRKAENNVIRAKPVIPPRGNIYDRDVEIFVSNQPMFSMSIVKDELRIPAGDTLMLCNFLNITLADLKKMLQEARPKQDYVIARYIDPKLYGKMQEKLWDFEGISFTATTRRSYRYETGANILGYINEVSQEDIRNSGGQYKQGDLIGRTGIERSHDTTLRGEQGIRKVIKNVHNREIGNYAGGRFDKQALKGKDILLGLDTELQQFGERLMQNKKGSIVCIEPASGEILAFVSAPTYNPSDLTGRDLYNNWTRLQKDSLEPMYNRPLQARYPPGSIFKLAVALAALQEGTLHPDTYYGCGGGFKRNRGKPGCRAHISPLSLNDAIQYSCNSYFAATYMDLIQSDKYDNFYTGYETWHEYMNRLGVGRVLGVDLPYEVGGLLPSSARYDKIYGKDNWRATTVISNAIGQGEILMTPLQMANMVAIIANRGKYIAPHFVRAYRHETKTEWSRILYDTLRTGIARRHFEVVIDAMEEVVSSGTARRAFIEGIPVCGKTGTVQNPHGEDHAVFVGFAPKDNPQIAVAVVIENAGGGGSWAAPTASLMIEQYLQGKISRTPEYERILEASFIKARKKR